MIKRIVLISMAVLMLFPFMRGEVTNSYDFLATAIGCGAGATVVNGVGFTSKEVSTGSGLGVIGTLVVTFTRSGSGASDVVEFHIQGSQDGGTTWTTADVYSVEIATDTDNGGSGSVVTVMKFINLNGVSRLRLYKIVNNDSSETLTAIQVTLGA